MQHRCLATSWCLSVQPCCSKIKITTPCHEYHPAALFFMSTVPSDVCHIDNGRLSLFLSDCSNVVPTPVSVFPPGAVQEVVDQHVSQRPRYLFCRTLRKRAIRRQGDLGMAKNALVGSALPERPAEGASKDAPTQIPLTLTNRIPSTTIAHRQLREVAVGTTNPRIVCSTADE